MHSPQLADRAAFTARGGGPRYAERCAQLVVTSVQTWQVCQVCTLHFEVVKAQKAMHAEDPGSDYNVCILSMECDIEDATWAFSMLILLARKMLLKRLADTAEKCLQQLPLPALLHTCSEPQGQAALVFAAREAWHWRTLRLTVSWSKT